MPTFYPMGRVTQVNLYATCIPGLERIAAEELRWRVPGALVMGCEAGVVRFVGGEVGELLGMRTTEDLFVHLADIEGIAGDEAGLAAIEAGLAECGVEEAVRWLHGGRGACPLNDADTRDLTCMRTRDLGVRFRITATREGAHCFRSPEVAARAGSGVMAQTGWRADLTNPDVDIWVQVRGERAIVGLRVSDDTMRRRSRVLHGPASLRPTLAHAMCLLAELRAGDVLLDPMCGTGTILVEAGGVSGDVRGESGDVSCRPLTAPAERISGGDVSCFSLTAPAPAGQKTGYVRLGLVGCDTYAPALAAARENLRAAGMRGLLVRADARAAPLRDGWVDRIVCNLPWGKRVGSHRYNLALYPAFLAEARRLLRTGGRMVLLTHEKRLMERCLAEAEGLRLREAITVRVGGLAPDIYVVDCV